MSDAVCVVADQDTGLIIKRNGKMVVVFEDFFNCDKECDENEPISLKYSACKERKEEGDFLWILSAWKTFRGVRKIRLQCHRIRKDRSPGTREIVFERHNGRHVRP